MGGWGIGLANRDGVGGWWVVGMDGWVWCVGWEGGSNWNAAAVSPPSQPAVWLWSHDPWSVQTVTQLTSTCGARCTNGVTPPRAMLMRSESELVAACAQHDPQSVACGGRTGDHETGECK